MFQYKNNRIIIAPSLDKTNDNLINIDPVNGNSPNLPFIFASGQHVIRGGDRWGIIRKQSGVNMMLDWMEPYVNDYRYKYFDDDRIQYLFPEVESPWKFPDSIFYVSGVNINPSLDGHLIEPTYWLNTPADQPINSMFKITDPSLPEYGIRLGVSGNYQAKSVSWGPEHNIDVGLSLMCAPFEWLGRNSNEIGEEWELQGNPKVTSSGTSYEGVNGRFPQDMYMPHGDPDPLWNDGLDFERAEWKDKNRREAAIKRGSSDRFLSSWADVRQGQQQSYSNESGEIEVISSDVGFAATEIEKLSGKYNYTNSERWFDPSRFNTINNQNYQRRMTKCLFCFKADKCNENNNPVRKVSNTQELIEDPTKASGSVGTTGFIRNHIVDIKEDFVPNDTLAKIYANSYCMYSTNVVFEKNFASIKQEDESLTSYLERNDNTSNVCQVNGAPRRTVEYDGHYRLLLEEILTPIMETHHDSILQLHVNKGEQTLLELKWNEHLFKMEYVGLDYQQNHLYKIYVDSYPTNLVMGQYQFHYDELNENPKILFWVSIKWSHLFSRWLFSKVWAYIWYASNHTDIQQRTLIKRLVELKQDYGMFYGNATEARTSEDFTGGNSDLRALPTIGDSLRGVYKELPEGSKNWLWFDSQYSLLSSWNTYKDDSHARASGVLEIFGQPGEIIPNNFIAYKHPKMISWGKSKTDQVTQTSLGKTRIHYDDYRNEYFKEIGDIDDLYYHLRYDDPRAEGALTFYPKGMGHGKGYYSHFLKIKEKNEAVNTANSEVIISDPLDISDKTIKENHNINDRDIVLFSDIQHARNFTAPIFAYHLTSRVPYHNVVKPDFILHETDWGRRIQEPDSVMYQREYAPEPSILCFAKNSNNRERSIQARRSDFSPIELFWLPEGRVWWNKHGLLGVGKEFGEDFGQLFSGNQWSQSAVAVVNLWKRYLPHHMQIVKSYLWLEPVQEDVFAPISLRKGLVIPRFDPFQGVSILTDTSEKSLEIKEAKTNAGIYTDIPGRQFGQYQIPIREAWDLVVEASHKIMGEWSFPTRLPMQWANKKSTQGWTEWDLNHKYLPISKQSELFIARGISVKINGQQVNSIDPDNPSSFAQRSEKWYPLMSLLYKDGSRITSQGSDYFSYSRNSNKFDHLNNTRDAGEGNTGGMDPLGKAYGHSSGGGGRKSPYIYDITNQVRQSYEDRIDVNYETVVDVFKLERKHTNVG